MFLPLFTAFLATTRYNLVFGEGDINSWSILDDLQYLNATCPLVDTCAVARTSDSLTAYACQCMATCARLGTCCFDSPYRSFTPSEISSSCRAMSSTESYFMVDRCPPDSVWQNLCQEEWNGDSDVLKIVPVTSLFTLITYKNYFCFRCHEATDDFRYWNVELGSFDHAFDPDIDRSGVTVTYDRRDRTWAAPLGAGGDMVPVVLNVKIPTEIELLPEPCDWSVVSRCAPTWEDRDVIDKCRAYTGMVNIRHNNGSLRYRNAHCAVCNYEDLRNMDCNAKYTGYGAKAMFSFTHLLDVNRSDGDKVGKIEQCEGDTLWDPYAKKCRELKCALPGYVVKEGKCTAP